MQTAKCDKLIEPFVKNAIGEALNDREARNKRGKSKLDLPEFREMVTYILERKASSIRHGLQKEGERECVLRFDEILKRLHGNEPSPFDELIKRIYDQPVGKVK
jgi:hypothetical protein